MKISFYRSGIIHAITVHGTVIPSVIWNRFISNFLKSNIDIEKYIPYDNRLRII